MTTTFANGAATHVAPGFTTINNGCGPVGGNVGTPTCCLVWDATGCCYVCGVNGVCTPLTAVNQVNPAHNSIGSMGGWNTQVNGLFNTPGVMNNFCGTPYGIGNCWMPGVQNFGYQCGMPNPGGWCGQFGVNPIGIGQVPGFGMGGLGIGGLGMGGLGINGLGINPLNYCCPPGFCPSPYTGCFTPGFGGGGFGGFGGGGFGGIFNNPFNTQSCGVPFGMPGFGYGNPWGPTAQNSPFGPGHTGQPVGNEQFRNGNTG